MFSPTRFGAWTLAAMVASAAIGCRQESQQGPPALPKVTVGHPVIRKIVDEDDYNGWLQATQTVDVRARVRGHILKIHFRDGDMVKQDQLLIELDPRPFQAAVDGTLAAAHAVEAQRVASEKETARNATLLASHSVSQQEYEKTLADTQALAAQVKSRMQEVEREKLDLEFSRITAPIAGRIGRAQLTVGNLVSSGANDPVLATIVAVDPMYVYFPIDERSLQRYQRMELAHTDRARGEPLRDLKLPFHFGLDIDEGLPHEGTLDFVDNRLDQSTGTVEARGVVRNDKGLFMAGARVRVRVPVSDPYEALLVPDLAVLSDQEKKYLLVLGKDNVVLRRDVALGKLLDDGMRVVRPALAEPVAPGVASVTGKASATPPVAPGDWVITLGLQNARVNYPVEPLDAQGRPALAKPTANDTGKASATPPDTGKASATPPAVAP